MDLSKASSILIFGGTFDPPHRAHVVLPEQVRQQRGVDAIAYVPAGRAPNKADAWQSAGKHRLAMLQLSLQDHPRATILQDELERGEDEPTYTIDTLERLRRRLPREVELRLLIGADQLRSFGQWREPERIIELARPLVMVRPPDSTRDLAEAYPDWRDRLCDVDAIDLSSSELRQCVREGRKLGDAVHPDVADYIARHGLYRESTAAAGS